MTVPERDPWWASGAGPQDEGTDAGPARDPVEAHRAARSGGDGEDRADDAGSGGEHDQRAGPAAPLHDPDICGVCPICVGLRALGEARPELVAHLTEAARHLTAAARSVIEDVVRASEASSNDDQEPGPGRGQDRVTRIDLD